MTVYAVALINIHDREHYGRYEAGFMEIFSKYQGSLLAVDEAPTLLEGEWPWTRTVLLAFPDAEKLRAWYDSEEYRALAQHRFAGSEASIAIVKSLE